MSTGDEGSGGNAPRKPHSEKSGMKPRRRIERFAAIDLGTNNCRLLVASPERGGFRIVDAFSRIVRLGEGLSRTGSLSEAATDRALEALKICAAKIEKRRVTHLRCIATQACRGAANGAAFLARVKEETGLEFDIISPEEEARLAVRGCSALFDKSAEAGIVFDIGGGSTELSWILPGADGADPDIASWVSLPFGVVSIAERWGGKDLSAAAYSSVVHEVREAISSVGDPANLRPLFQNGNAHFLGTSGTVTSIAGVHLQLRRYRRDRVDGLWLKAADVREVASNLRKMSFEERASEPCIGMERADLVVCGCAILEALLDEWPVDRIRVADRGLREGILADLAHIARKERGRRRRKRRGGQNQ